MEERKGCIDANNQIWWDAHSTASRVLTQTEGRYSVAEQELLAIVFELDKFRTYVFGNEVHLRTDNKDLSFLDKCAFNF
jgi:hypothetical protein